MDVKILVQPTPNPNARKYIVNMLVKAEGKASFLSRDEALDLPLVRDLFDIDGVEQIHLFDNFITVTKFEAAAPWNELEPQVRSIIETRMAVHDPKAKMENKAPVKDRSAASPEIQKIEEILDRTIRPGLQGDGGDLEVLSFDAKVLNIRYQGACGTCPSSIAGTLQAIESILQNEFDPELRVIAV